jgi:hypothetical protein
LNYSRAGQDLLGWSDRRGVDFADFEAAETAARFPVLLGGGRWIRTTEGVSQQIYSLPPLAAWVSLRISFVLIFNSGRWMTPGILPFALRAVSLRDTFKFAPGEFVEPPKA